MGTETNNKQRTLFCYRSVFCKHIRDAFFNWLENDACY